MAYDRSSYSGESTFSNRRDGNSRYDPESNRGYQGRRSRSPRASRRPRSRSSERRYERRIYDDHRERDRQPRLRSRSPQVSRRQRARSPEGRYERRDHHRRRSPSRGGRARERRSWSRSRSRQRDESDRRAERRGHDRRDRSRSRQRHHSSHKRERSRRRDERRDRSRSRRRERSSRRDDRRDRSREDSYDRPARPRGHPKRKRSRDESYDRRGYSGYESRRMDRRSESPESGRSRSRGRNEDRERQARSDQYPDRDAGRRSDDIRDQWRRPDVEESRFSSAIFEPNKKKRRNAGGNIDSVDRRQLKAGTLAPRNSTERKYVEQQEHLRQLLEGVIEPILPYEFQYLKDMRNQYAVANDSEPISRKDSTALSDKETPAEFRSTGRTTAVASGSKLPPVNHGAGEAAPRPASVFSKSKTAQTQQTDKGDEEFIALLNDGDDEAVIAAVDRIETGLAGKTPRRHTEQGKTGTASGSKHPLPGTTPAVNPPDDATGPVKTGSHSKEPSRWTYKSVKLTDGCTPQLHYCTTIESCQEAAKKFMDCKIVGFDAEWKAFCSPTNVKEGMSVIQVASKTDIAIFHLALIEPADKDKPNDILAPALKTLIEDDKLYKVGCNIKGDMTRVKSWLPVAPASVIELMDYSKAAKLPKNGLDAQFKHLYKEELDKGSVRVSDWSKNLSIDQQTYAANDAYASLLVYDGWKQVERQAHQAFLTPKNAKAVAEPTATDTQSVPQPLVTNAGSANTDSSPPSYRRPTISEIETLMERYQGPVFACPDNILYGGPCNAEFQSLQAADNHFRSAHLPEPTTVKATSSEGFKECPWPDTPHVDCRRGKRSWNLNGQPYSCHKHRHEVAGSAHLCICGKPCPNELALALHVSLRECDLTTVTDADEVQCVFGPADPRTDVRLVQSRQNKGGNVCSWILANERRGVDPEQSIIVLDRYSEQAPALDKQIETAQGWAESFFSSNPRASRALIHSASCASSTYTPSLLRWSEDRAAFNVPADGNSGYGRPAAQNQWSAMLCTERWIADLDACTGETPIVCSIGGDGLSCNIDRIVRLFDEVRPFLLQIAFTFNRDKLARLKLEDHVDPDTWVGQYSSKDIVKAFRGELHDAGLLALKDYWSTKQLVKDLSMGTGRHTLPTSIRKTQIRVVESTSQRKHQAKELEKTVEKQSSSLSPNVPALPQLSGNTAHPGAVGSASNIDPGALSPASAVGYLPQQAQGAINEMPDDFDHWNIKDWTKLPAFTFTLSTLPEKDFEIPPERQRSPLNKHDPNRHLVHPKEFSAASLLRLDCAQYLHAKRRLMCEVVHRLRRGVFVQRDMIRGLQKVDKVTKPKLLVLFDNFERLGWFEPSALGVSQTKTAQQESTKVVRLTVPKQFLAELSSKRSAELD